MNDIDYPSPKWQIPMKYGKWVGVALVISMILMIMLPFFIIFAEPPIDIIGAMFPTPYPTTFFGHIQWSLGMIPYQLSWRVPLMTLWFYSVYVFFIIWGAQYLQLIEFVEERGA